MKKISKKLLTRKRASMTLRRMHGTIVTPPSRYDLDEHSKQQLDYVRREYGSLAQFLKKTQRNKAISRFVAIYGRDSTDTDIAASAKPANRSR